MFSPRGVWGGKVHLKKETGTGCTSKLCAILRVCAITVTLYTFLLWSKLRRYSCKWFARHLIKEIPRFEYSVHFANFEEAVGVWIALLPPACGTQLLESSQNHRWFLGKFFLGKLIDTHRPAGRVRRQKFHRWKTRKKHCRPTTDSRPFLILIFLTYPKKVIQKRHFCFLFWILILSQERGCLSGKCLVDTFFGCR